MNQIVLSLGHVQGGVAVMFDNPVVVPLIVLQMKSSKI